MKATVGAVGKESESVEENVYMGVVHLMPNEILIDEAMNVRPWSTLDDEQEQIEALARSIERDGQINAVTVRFSDTDGYHLITGRRRLAAINLINSKRGDDRDPIQVKCDTYVRMNDDQAFRQALMENAQRKNASAMDNAGNIQAVRFRYGWTDGKSTRKVADYFGMSPAWVTTHEKLLQLDKETQLMIQANGWSAQAAIDLAQSQEGKRAEVVERSEELADEEAKVTGKKKKVKGRHVRQAIRERQAETVVKVRTAKELREFFGQFDSDAYGPPKGVIRDFLKYFDKWASGGGTDRTMRDKFDGLLGYAVPIIEPSAVKPEASVKAAVKKAAKKQAAKKQAAKSTGSKTKPKPKK